MQPISGHIIWAISYDHIIWPFMTPSYFGWQFLTALGRSMWYFERLTGDDSIVMIYSKQFIVVNAFFRVIIQFWCYWIVSWDLEIFVVTTISLQKSTNENRERSTNQKSDRIFLNSSWVQLGQIVRYEIRYNCFEGSNIRFLRSFSTFQTMLTSNDLGGRKSLKLVKNERTCKSFYDHFFLFECCIGPD